MILYAHEVRQNEKQRKTKIQHVAKHLLYVALCMEVLQTGDYPVFGNPYVGAGA